MQTLDTSVRGLVFGLADADGAIDAATLYLAAEAAGFSTTKIRLGLRRLDEADLVVIEGRGRQARIALTPTAIAARRPDLVWTGAAHRMDAGLDVWDGRWHLAAFEIPEAQRAARDALRTRIVDLFGGALGAALYLSPLGWEPWLLATADRHGIRDRLTLTDTDRLTHAGSDDPVTIASTVWPIDAIDQRYRDFVDSWRDAPAQVPDDPHQAIHHAFAAAEAFEAVFRTDPLLPPELVPEDFSGPSARALFVELLAAMSEHEVVAHADLFSSYRAAVDRAIRATPADFWRAAFAQTA